MLKVGSAHVFELPFTGNPQPKVTWSFNDNPIKNERFAEETIRNMTTLRMKSIQMSDAGNYTITLTSLLGISSLTIALKVIG